MYKDRFAILTYHRVLPRTDELFPEELTAADFDAQMGMLARFFNVLSLSDALDRLERGSLPSRCVVVTFDDGYADNRTEALPVLKKHGLVATFFIATGFLDGSLMWNDRIINAVRTSSEEKATIRSLDIAEEPLVSAGQRRRLAETLIGKIKYRPGSQRGDLIAEIEEALGGNRHTQLMMSQSQVREMSDAGMEIGAHTVNHPILETCTLDEAKAEIQSSRTFLSGLTGCEIELFAYPNGRKGQDYSSAHAELVRKMQFRAAVTTNPGVVGRRSPIYELPRFGVWDKRPHRFALRTARSLLNSPSRG